MKKNKIIKSLFSDGGETFLKSLIEFDENGNEIRREIYAGPQFLETKTIYSYNIKGLLIEEINYGENEEETDRTNIERDDDGNPLKTIITYADSSKTIKSYKREDNNKTITVSEESDEGEFESLEKIFLDLKGNIIQRISYDEEENIIEKHDFEYNDNNDIIKEISFTGKEKVSETHFIYDEKNNIIKRIILNSEGELIDRALYKYDENGRNIEQQYGDHTLYKMEFNEKGMISKEQKVNAMGVVDYSKQYFYNDENMLVEEVDLHSKTIYEYEFF